MKNQRRFGLRRQKQLKKQSVQLGDGTLFNPKNPNPGEFLGLWNGERCRMRYLEIIVKDEEESAFELPWWKPYVGEKFHCIEINYYMNKYYISNADGSGMYKVTVGKGMPNCGSASFETVELVRVVEKREEWIMEYSPKVSEEIAQRSDAFWMEKDPVTHAEIVKMRSAAMKLASQSLAERTEVKKAGTL